MRTGAVSQRSGSDNVTAQRKARQRGKGADVAEKAQRRSLLLEGRRDEREAEHRRNRRRSVARRPAELPRVDIREPADRPAKHQTPIDAQGQQGGQAAGGRESRGDARIRREHGAGRPEQEQIQHGTRAAEDAAVKDCVDRGHGRFPAAIVGGAERCGHVA